MHFLPNSVPNMHYNALFQDLDAPASAVRGHTKTTRATAPIVSIAPRNERGASFATFFCKFAACSTLNSTRYKSARRAKEYPAYFISCGGPASASKHSQKLRDAKSDL